MPWLLTQKPIRLKPLGCLLKLPDMDFQQLYTLDEQNMPNQICESRTKMSLALWPVDHGLTSSVQMSTFITGLAISAVLPFGLNHLSTAKMRSSVHKTTTKKKIGNTTNVTNGLKHFTKIIKIKERALSVWLLIQLLPFLPQWRLQILLGHCLLDGVHRKAI